MSIKKTFLVVFLFVFIGFFFYPAQKRFPPMLEWMAEQIHRDLLSCSAKDVSEKMDALFNSEKGQKLWLARVKIQNSVVSCEKYELSGGYEIRLKRMLRSLQELSRKHPLPDTEFLLSLLDAVNEDTDVPIFAFAKPKNVKGVILIPDFDAVRGKYQVLKDKDIVTYDEPWKDKKNQLVWRGSTAQTPVNSVMTRIVLCELSDKFPELIDAKITRNTHINSKRYKNLYISYQDQLHYKYQMLIDGVTCAYTNSAWKLFSYSAIFKPDSENIQWYYNSLKPYVHYIPVQSDLSDLLAKIEWAILHDEEVEKIARNSRDFARGNLKQSDNLMYIYYLISEFSRFLTDNKTS